MNQAVKKTLIDTLTHKRYVHQSCWKMAQYFIANGEEDKALEIMRRAALHDTSKLYGQELEQLSQIDDDFASMKDPNVHLNEGQKALIALHYKNNTYYPEHWKDIAQMPAMDVVEMVCDWHARSTEFETDLIEFAKIRQQNRFHFPSEMFEQILKYCEILVS